MISKSGSPYSDSAATATATTEILTISKYDIQLHKRQPEGKYDDSALARKQMARALPTGLADKILFANDGVEALEKLRAHEADLMFLDLNMPEMDGYEVLERVLAEDLPVMTIVVSGDIQPEARERVRKLGAIDFIKKPTDLAIVLSLLADYGFYRPGDPPLSA